MRFFDSKEEVLDIQLTQIGKRKLSQGTFKPYYYNFFDDDILYDASYGRTSEEQNESVPRILDNTPRLRAHYLQQGVDTNFKRIRAQKMLGNNANNKIMDRNTPNLPMGVSARNEYLPAWDGKFRGDDAKIETFDSNYSASWGVVPIPQISSSLTVETRIEFQEEFASFTLSAFAEEKEKSLVAGRPLFDPEKSTGLLSTESEPDVYPDGSYIVTVQPSLLLDVSEVNNEFTNENFDMEIFEVLTDPAGPGTSEVKQILRPLKFGASGDPYSKSQLLSEDAILENPDFVGHFVEAFADGELGRHAIDKLMGRKTSGASAKTFVGPSPYRSGDSTGQLPDDDLKEPC